MQSLALAYRPKTFDDLVGQRAVQVILQKMVASNAVPHALLFAGSRGTGKTTTGRILAAALNCENSPRPCGHCVSCKSIYDGVSFDVLEIDAASNGLVDNIRDLREQVMFQVPGNYRVVILDEAHSVSQAGFNALLKTIEEPPPATVFALLTTEPHKIPDTVLSRCMPFTFRRLSVADIAGRLAHINEQENLQVEHDLLVLMAERADGALRDAIMLLDQAGRAGIRTLDEYGQVMGDRDIAPQLLMHILDDKLDLAFGLLDDNANRTADLASISSGLISVLKDVLVLNCGSTPQKTDRALQQRKNLAARLDSPSAVAVMKILWELKTKLRLDDQKSSLDLAVTLMHDFLTKTSTPPAAAPKLTLAQMATTRGK